MLPLASRARGAWEGDSLCGCVSFSVRHATITGGLCTLQPAASPTSTASAGVGQFTTVCVCVCVRPSEFRTHQCSELSLPPLSSPFPSPSLSLPSPPPIPIPLPLPLPIPFFFSEVASPMPPFPIPIPQAESPPSTVTNLEQWQQAQLDTAPGRHGCGETYYISTAATGYPPERS